MAFDWEYLWSYTPQLLDGLWMTLLVSAVSITGGTIMGALGGLVLYRGNRTAAASVRGVVLFIQNTPLLVQLFFVFNGLPEIMPGLSVFWSGTVTLIISTAAYMADTTLVGLRSVEGGLHDAARALGLRESRFLWLIALPIAARVALPASLNIWIFTFKNTALLEVIGLPEMNFVAVTRIANDFRFIEMVTSTTAVYVGLVLLMSWASATLEKRLAKPYGA